MCYKHNVMIKDYRKTTWRERLPWLMVVLPVTAILVTIGIQWWRDHKAQLDENARVNAEINLISQTALDFDSIVQQYIALARNHDSQAKGYYDRILSDPRVSRMHDLEGRAVPQWPSVESCDAFRAYYDASFRLLETSVDGRPLVSVEDRVKAYDGKLEALQKALNPARR